MLQHIIVFVYLQVLTIRIRNRHIDRNVLLLNELRLWDIHYSIALQCTCLDHLITHLLRHHLTRLRTHLILLRTHLTLHGRLILLGLTDLI